MPSTDKIDINEFALLLDMPINLFTEYLKKHDLKVYKSSEFHDEIFLLKSEIPNFESIKKANKVKQLTLHDTLNGHARYNEFVISKIQGIKKKFKLDFTFVETIEYTRSTNAIVKRAIELKILKVYKLSNMLFFKKKHVDNFLESEYFKTRRKRSI